MKFLTTIGEILVEIMADTPGHGFAEPQPLTDPAFPTLLAALQEDLGHLNDITFARTLGQTLPDAPEVLAHAQTQWATLLATPRFWAATP